MTGTLINYKPTFLGNTIRVEVTAYFLKDSSWRVRKLLSYYMLNHERRNFFVNFGSCYNSIDYFLMYQIGEIIKFVENHTGCVEGEVLENSDLVLNLPSLVNGTYNIQIISFQKEDMI